MLNSETDVAWTCLCSMVYFFMVPGVGLSYNALTESKNSLHIFMLCFLAFSISNIEWCLFGHSLALFNNSNIFIGNFKNSFLINILNNGSINDKLLGIVTYLSNTINCSLLTTTLVGGIVSRGRIISGMLFISLWIPFVFCFTTYWVKSDTGFASRLGAINYSSGSSNLAVGMSALVYSFMLKKRNYGSKSEYLNSSKNTFLLITGTFFVWFAWLGMIAGSTPGPSYTSIRAIISINLAGSIGSLLIVLIEYFKTGLFIPDKFCTGALGGLITTSPAAGYMNFWSAFITGSIGALACTYLAPWIKHKLKVDEPINVFDIHGVGGFIGTVLVAFVSRKEYAILNNKIIDGGIFDGRFKMLGLQLFLAVCVTVWSVLVSYIIIRLINFIPKLDIRVSEDEENDGLDITQLGISTCRSY